MRYFMVTALMMSVVMSCRIAKVGKNVSSESPKAGADAAPVTILQPQKGSSETYAQTLAVTLDAAGKVNGTLSLRLDYAAAPKPGGVTLPGCYEPLAGHLVIGKLVCGTNKAVTSDIQVNQLDQICHSESTTPKAASKNPVTLPNCTGAATLRVYQYEPAVKMELQ